MTKGVADSVIAGALIFACVALGVSSSVVVNSCTPEQQAKTAKAEADLCKLRGAERDAEAVYPSLTPAQGSIREQIESAEDAFCASRSDASP